MATLQSCRSMLISCLLRLYTNTNGETEGQNTWNESGKSKHSNCNQAETKTNRKKVTEWEKASRGMKRGWGVLMETRVSVASCVCGSVTEGRPLALRSHQCQWTKSPLNWLIWFACRAAACPLPSSMTYSTVCTSGFSSHSPFPFFSFLCLSLPLFFLDRTFFFFFGICSNLETIIREGLLQFSILGVLCLQKAHGATQYFRHASVEGCVLARIWRFDTNNNTAVSILRYCKQGDILQFPKSNFKKAAIV